MFKSFFAKKKRVLSGAPVVRRMKTYSAQSGYVYQYFYEGNCAYQSGRERGAEFVFSVSPDRKSWHETSVLVSDEGIAAWEQAHERQLSSTERYAVAKIALMQAFDDRAEPALMRDAVRVRLADVEGIVEALGL